MNPLPSNESTAYVEVLDRHECLALLSAAPFVRVAYCAGGEVHVLPVNAVFHDDEVVVRTSYGGKLAAAARDAEMTIQADEIDPVTRTGWDVQIQGRSRVIDDLDVLALLELVDVQPWAPGRKEFFIGVTPHVVTGRRLVRQTT